MPSVSAKQIMVFGFRAGSKGRLRIFLVRAKKLSEKLIGTQVIILGGSPAQSFAA